MVYSKAWLLSHAIKEMAFERVLYQALVDIITCTPSYVTFDGKNRSTKGQSLKWDTSFNGSQLAKMKKSIPDMCLT